MKLTKNVLIIFAINMLVHSNNKMVSSTVISNLNLMFETFNPLSMVRFFEFNDKGWNITDGCIQDMFLYLDGLHKDILWATKCKKYNVLFFFFLFLSEIMKLILYLHIQTR